MRLWRRISWASLALVAIVGCSGGEKATGTVAATEENIDPWVLVWTDPTNDTPAFLSGQSLGCRFARDGTTLQGDSPLPCFTRRFAQKARGESKFPYKWKVDGVRLDPKEGSDYSQSLDMRSGALTTSWVQIVEGKRIKIKSTSIVGTSFKATWTFSADSGAVLSRTEADGTVLSTQKMPLGEEVVLEFRPSASEQSVGNIFTADIELNF